MIKCYTVHITYTLFLEDIFIECNSYMASYLCCTGTVCSETCLMNWKGENLVGWMASLGHTSTLGHTFEQMVLLCGKSGALEHRT